MRCETDYTSWPFDEQNCTIHLGSWAHTGDELILIGTGLVYVICIAINFNLAYM